MGKKMNTHIRQAETGRFQEIPFGQKTRRMKDVEQKLGRSLEEDYLEKYYYGDYGQKRLANRWSVERKAIFSKGRGWARRLGLPMKDDSEAIQGDILPLPVSRRSRDICAYCKISYVSPDGAHWVPAKLGSPNVVWNKLNLCSAHHKLLDDIYDRGSPSSDEKNFVFTCARLILDKEISAISSGLRNNVDPFSIIACIAHGLKVRIGFEISDVIFPRIDVPKHIDIVNAHLEHSGGIYELIESGNKFLD